MSDRAEIHLRRLLTSTPLARRHERILQGKLTRAPRPIPWHAFERERHPEDALLLLGDLCEKLAAGEYAAIGLFSRITAGLAISGAPFDLILAASRASSDEARHADYALKMAEVCAGQDVKVPLPAEAVGSLSGAAFDLETLDFAMLYFVAVTETLAAALLTECRRRAQDPVARAFFTAVVSDELHHARLGWYYAAHRAPELGNQERQRLADRLAERLVEIESEFWIGRDAPRETAAAARALGVLDSEAQQSVVAFVMESEIVPGLDALGFGASSAWALRRRGRARG